MGIMRYLYDEARYGVQALLAGIPGKRWYVSSVTGTANGPGRNMRTAYATVAQAYAQCRADYGDAIICLPGHAEAIANGTTIAMAKAGVYLIGLGPGGLIPTFTLGTATGANLACSAPNVTFAGIKIISDFADVAIGISASPLADGLTVSECEIEDGAAAKELVIGVNIAAACNNVTIVNNRFKTVDGGGCESAIKLAGESADSLIRGNRIFGDYSVAGIDGEDAAANRLWIMENLIRNAETTAGLCISLHASSTGVIARNLAAGNKATTHPISAAAAACFENYGLDDDRGASGLLSPAASDFGT